MGAGNYYDWWLSSPLRYTLESGRIFLNWLMMYLLFSVVHLFLFYCSYPPPRNILLFSPILTKSLQRWIVASGALVLAIARRWPSSGPILLCSKYQQHYLSVVYWGICTPSVPIWLLFCCSRGAAVSDGWLRIFLAAYSFLVWAVRVGVPSANPIFSAVCFNLLSGMFT